MSVEALTAVLHHSKATGSAKLVLLGIANHEGDGGAWPTIETLAKYAGMAGQPENNARAVRRLLRQLEQLGELRTLTNEGGTADRPWWSRPNLYVVTVACPPECDGTSRHRMRNPQTPGSDNPGDALTPGSDNPVPPGSGDPANRPSTQTTVVKVGASTTDHAREATAPPLDALATVREQLHAASLQHHKRAAGVA